MPLRISPAFPISLPSRGASLFAGTISTSLKREMLDAVVLNGFFPQTAVADFPARRRTLGLKEFGLDYAADPALSKHLAFFLARSFQNTRASESLSALVAKQVRRRKGSNSSLPPRSSSTAAFQGGASTRAGP